MPKCLELGIDGSPRKASKIDDDDDEFEDVPDKDIPSAYNPEVYGVLKEPSVTFGGAMNKSKSDVEFDEKDPTSYVATLKQQKSLPIVTVSGDLSVPETQKRTKDAPVIPFDTDLVGWGSKPVVPEVQNFDSLHRFWRPSDEVEKSDTHEAAIEALGTRRISFAGNFQPVSHKCFAPLGKGKLCQRMDRKKCPFHGIIIPRDELGQPLEESSTASQSKEVVDSGMNDTELQKDIEAALGVQLLQQTKGKKRKFLNLTDVTKETDTSRSRLEKKLKKASRYVAEELDDLDERRNHAKFSHQFNYAIKR